MLATSASLLDRLHGRADPTAWDRLVELYSPLIRGWLRRHSVPPADAEDLTQEVFGVLLKRFPDFDEEIRIHVNGCPNSCARFQVADIGLMSALDPRPDGTKSDAFLVHLGGAMGATALS